MLYLELLLDAAEDEGSPVSKAPVLGAVADMLVWIAPKLCDNDQTVVEPARVRLLVSVVDEQTLVVGSCVLLMFPLLG